MRESDFSFFHRDVTSSHIVVAIHTRRSRVARGGGCETGPER